MSPTWRLFLCLINLLDFWAYWWAHQDSMLLQSIELAVAAEELGADGAYFRVHHFARQLSSPFPLLAACGAKTKRIEIGTAVIDMRYENPMYMAEDAGAADR
jgi:alkanesulfonate monooxygenase SsuD/methylene tetrahydromethanopterin reductase-like flavin-dependent oxidoreductase (luciferase family)